MSLAELTGRLTGIANALAQSEEATKQGAVLPILAELGWDRDDITQVVPEYQVGNGRVDYCLRIGEREKVFVEVKRAGEQLDQHQEQLLDYAFRQGVNIAVLTNGLVWWLYLPLFEGGWEERKFLALDLEHQDPNRAAEHFVRFLSRERTEGGQAVESATELHEGEAREREIRRTIPRAWRELCTQPDEPLLELLAEKVESLCGHRPQANTLEGFLTTHGLQHIERQTPIRAGQAPPGQTRQANRAQQEQTVRHRNNRAPVGRFTHTRPTSFSLFGQTRQVRYNKDLLLGVCDILAQREGVGFQRVLELRAGRRPYFSTDPDELNRAEEIADTGIFVETVFSADQIASLLDNILRHFGYDPKELSVERI